jgi:hypothetical protein
MDTMTTSTPAAAVTPDTGGAQPPGREAGTGAAPAAREHAAGADSDNGGLPTAEQVAAAEKDMNTLLAPPPGAPSTAGQAAGAAAGKTAAVAVMTALGVGVRLAAEPGGWRVAGGVCAGLLLAHGYAGAARACHQWLPRVTAGEPWWLASARVCERSQCEWADPVVLAAAAKHLGAVGGRYPSAHLYVARCGPQGRHTYLCRAGTVVVTSGRLLLVIGEHIAAAPAVAAAVIAHECGHQHRGRHLAFGLLGWARGYWAGWGWAAAGALAGWPWVLAAVPAFQVASVLALWTVEAGCDLAAARAQGYPAVLDALAFKPAHTVRTRPQTLAYWLATRT